MGAVLNEDFMGCYLKQPPADTSVRHRYHDSLEFYGVVLGLKTQQNSKPDYLPMFIFRHHIKRIRIGEHS